MKGKNAGDKVENNLEVDVTTDECVSTNESWPASYDDVRGKIRL